ncbi:MAG TPA: hypothetical protein PLS90_02380 [Candidatus Sumerlaeota bacterium]|nr:hypothetical protein [Candidatus Sumerlaeota bacterium]
MPHLPRGSSRQPVRRAVRALSALAAAALFAAACDKSPQVEQVAGETPPRPAPTPAAEIIATPPPEAPGLALDLSAISPEAARDSAILPDESAPAAIPDAAEPAGGGELLTLRVPPNMPAAITGFWDGKVENVIYVIHKGWNSAIFDIHLFEDLLLPTTSDVRFNNNRKLDETLFRWKVVEPGREWNFYISQESVLQFDMRGHVFVRGNEAVVEGEITNRSPLEWPHGEAQGLMCIRTRHNPDFWDQPGERILYYRTDGTTLTVARAIQSAERDTFPFFATPLHTNERDLLPRISKVNKTGDRRVTVESNPGSSLGGNRLDTMCCIHANVDLAAKPGETVYFQTVVRFEDLATTSTTTTGP